MAAADATRLPYTVLSFSRNNGRLLSKRHYAMLGGKNGAREAAKAVDKKLERVDIYDNGMKALCLRLQ